MLTARDDDKVGNVDAVIMEDFFRNTLVLAKGETGGATAGEG